MLDTRLTDRKKNWHSKKEFNQLETAKELGVNNHQSIPKTPSTIPKKILLTVKHK